MFRKSLSEHRLVIIGRKTCMSLATGANFEFWLDCLVRTNRTSCTLLKIMET
jgi:hypothetical protein